MKCEFTGWNKMVSDSESEKRCYICNRNIDDVLSLFNIENEKIPNHIKKMKKETFSLGKAFFDEYKSRVYPYTEILEYDTMMFLLKEVKDDSIRKVIKNKYDSGNRIGTFYINVDFEHEHHNEQLISYIKKGGRIILNPEVVNIEFDYYFCPICNVRIVSLYNYAGKVY